MTTIRRTDQDDVLSEQYRELAADLRRWADALTDDKRARVVASVLANFALVAEREAERLDIPGDAN